MDFCRRHVGFGTKAGWQCKLVSLLSNPVIHSGADTGVILHILVTTMKEYKDRDETVFDSSSISRSCYLNMPSISGHMKKSGVLTGTFQVLTGIPSNFLQHEYLSQTVTSCASSCHLCGSLPATFPVGSAGSRITGLQTTVKRGQVSTWAVSGVFRAPGRAKYQPG